jgi:hypothetical protein
VASSATQQVPRKGDNIGWRTFVLHTNEYAEISAGHLVREIPGDAAVGGAPRGPGARTIECPSRTCAERFDTDRDGVG